MAWAGQIWPRSALAGRAGLHVWAHRSPEVSGSGLAREGGKGKGKKKERKEMGEDKVSGFQFEYIVFSVFRKKFRFQSFYDEE